MQLGDTIVAISTPPGRGGLGVVRLSGDASRAIAEGLLTEAPEWRPWTAQLQTLIDEDGSAIDQAVMTYFAKPRSYTAEDVIEIACHGSPVVLRRCLERAVALGARLAEPGEFTLRAYLNGRIDLPRAEAVRDLIGATTLYQARIAAQQMEGSVSRRLAPVKARLIELIALLEAGIDFAEDDISVAPAEEILGRLRPIAADVGELILSFAFGKLVHNGFSLAIAGRPNVGKSSLFNRLLEQDRAIVTEIAGTTRDTVSETVSIRGIPVRLIDTAGIRESGDKVEALGIERSYRAMADADLTVVVVDGSAAPTAEEDALIARAASQGRYIVARNKCDLAAFTRGAGMSVSAVSGEGIDELRDAIIHAIAPGGFEQDAGFITSIRHEQRLREASQALGQADAAAASGIPHEMVLLDLYGALQAIDAITGATTADDILNHIFSTFCIGK